MMARFEGKNLRHRPNCVSLSHHTPYLATLDRSATKLGNSCDNLEITTFHKADQRHPSNSEAKKQNSPTKTLTRPGANFVLRGATEKNAFIHAQIKVHPEARPINIRERGLRAESAFSLPTRTYNQPSCVSLTRYMSK